MKKEFDLALDYIRESKYTIAFTGAGISAESGIPPFRGENGLWNKYDPGSLVIERFYNDPESSWKIIRSIFYEYFGKTIPNKAHLVLARLELAEMLKCVITQNIDNLHQAAGSKTVYEYHGNAHQLICIDCKSVFQMETVSLNTLPPRCARCGGVLKPDFVFFGEAIPYEVHTKAVEAAKLADLVIIVGTSGEVMPACRIPFIAKQNGAKVIEINSEVTNFTDSLSDVFLHGKAGEIFGEIERRIFG